MWFHLLLLPFTYNAQGLPDSDDESYYSSDEDNDDEDWDNVDWNENDDSEDFEDGGEDDVE